MNSNLKLSLIYICASLNILFISVLGCSKIIDIRADQVKPSMAQYNKEALTLELEDISETEDMVTETYKEYQYTSKDSHINKTETGKLEQVTYHKEN